jgi:hypothetical protein
VAARAAAATAPPPINAGERLTETERAALEPALGVDTREVRVFQGPEESRALASANADAAATGDEIVLGPGIDRRTPAGVGVVAHELTHLVRRRAPWFVPPVARGKAAPTKPPAAVGVTPPVSDSASRAAEPPLPRQEGPFESLSAAEDEEPLAIRVESLVSRAAAAAVVGDSITAADTVFMADNGRPGSRAFGAQPMPLASSREADFGGLPAPWEPMPSWVTAQPQTVTPPAATHAASVSPAPAAAISTAAASLATASANSASGSAAVMLAEQGRFLEEPPAVEAHPGHDDGGMQPPPDLDHLARQIYAVMKRRLDAERRRELT